MKPDHRAAHVSLRDTAKRIGVSHVTDSFALRDHPRISLAVRQKIRHAAEEAGHRPNLMLTAQANYRKGKSTAAITAAIGWINAWNEPANLRSHKEFDFHWKGAVATAEKFGYRLEEIQRRGHSRSGLVTDEVDLKHSGHLFEGPYLPAQRQVAESERLPVFVMNQFPRPHPKRHSQPRSRNTRPTRFSPTWPQCRTC